MDLEISVVQAQALLTGDNPPLLLDVREPAEYALACIEPSTLIPMGELRERYVKRRCYEGRVAELSSSVGHAD